MSAWKILSQSDYITTRWSGGTTTQLAIAPAGAVYADRDFLWRLSSAGVDDDYSTFTALPDYNRLISVLHGSLDMKVGDGKRTPLPLLSVCSFDGGVPVESWGKCRDYNLMMRKGKCEGSLQSLVLSAGAQSIITPAIPAPARLGTITAAVYCVSGSLLLDGQVLSAGSLALCEDIPESSALKLSAESDSSAMIAWIFAD